MESNDISVSSSSTGSQVRWATVCAMKPKSAVAKPQTSKSVPTETGGQKISGAPETEESKTKDPVQGQGSTETKPVETVVSPVPVHNDDAAMNLNSVTNEKNDNVTTSTSGSKDEKTVVVDVAPTTSGSGHTSGHLRPYNRPPHYNPYYQGKYHSNRTSGPVTGADAASTTQREGGYHDRRTYHNKEGHGNYQNRYHNKDGNYQGYSHNKHVEKTSYQGNTEKRPYSDRPAYEVQIPPYTHNVPNVPKSAAPFDVSKSTLDPSIPPFEPKKRPFVPFKAHSLSQNGPSYPQMSHNVPSQRGGSNSGNGDTRTPVGQYVAPVSGHSVYNRNQKRVNYNSTLTTHTQNHQNSHSNYHHNQHLEKNHHYEKSNYQGYQSYGTEGGRVGRGGVSHASVHHHTHHKDSAITITLSPDAPEFRPSANIINKCATEKAARDTKDEVPMDSPAPTTTQESQTEPAFKKVSPEEISSEPILDLTSLVEPLLTKVAEAEEGDYEFSEPAFSVSAVEPVVDQVEPNDNDDAIKEPEQMVVDEEPTGPAVESVEPVVQSESAIADVSVSAAEPAEESSPSTTTSVLPEVAVEEIVATNDEEKVVNEEAQNEEVNIVPTAAEAPSAPSKLDSEANVVTEATPSVIEAPANVPIKRSWASLAKTPVKPVQKIKPKEDIVAGSTSTNTATSATASDKVPVGKPSGTKTQRPESEEDQVKGEVTKTKSTDVNIRYAPKIDYSAIKRPAIPVNKVKEHVKENVGKDVKEGVTEKKGRNRNRRGGAEDRKNQNQESTRQPHQSENSNQKKLLEKVVDQPLTENEISLAPAIDLGARVPPVVNPPLTGRKTMAQVAAEAAQKVSPTNEKKLATNAVISEPHLPEAKPLAKVPLLEMKSYAKLASDISQKKTKTMAQIASEAAQKPKLTKPVPSVDIEVDSPMIEKPSQADTLPVLGSNHGDLAIEANMSKKDLPDVRAITPALISQPSKPTMAQIAAGGLKNSIKTKQASQPAPVDVPSTEPATVVDPVAVVVDAPLVPSVADEPATGPSRVASSGSQTTKPKPKALSFKSAAVMGDAAARAEKNAKDAELKRSVPEPIPEVLPTASDLPSATSETVNDDAMPMLGTKATIADEKKVFSYARAAANPVPVQTKAPVDEPVVEKLSVVVDDVNDSDSEGSFVECESLKDIDVVCVGHNEPTNTSSLISETPRGPLPKGQWVSPLNTKTTTIPVSNPVSSVPAEGQESSSIQSSNTKESSSKNKDNSQPETSSSNENANSNPRPSIAVKATKSLPFGSVETDYSIECRTGASKMNRWMSIHNRVTTSDMDDEEDTALLEWVPQPFRSHPQMVTTLTSAMYGYIRDRMTSKTQPDIQHAKYNELEGQLTGKAKFHLDMSHASFVSQVKQRLSDIAQTVTSSSLEFKNGDPNIETTGQISFENMILKASDEFIDRYLVRLLCPTWETVCPVPIGFGNTVVGNVCFSSSVIQVLLSSPLFVRILEVVAEHLGVDLSLDVSPPHYSNYRENNVGDHANISTLRLLWSALQSTRRQLFFTTIGHHPMSARGEQHDAAEFLNSILDDLIEFSPLWIEESKVGEQFQSQNEKTLSADKKDDKAQKQFTDIFRRAYRGEIEVRHEMEDGKIRYTMEPYNVLMLHIDTIQGNCLSEILCAPIDKKGWCLATLQPLLFVQLSRLSYVSMAKSKDPVNVPNEIVIPPEALSERIRSEVFSSRPSEGQIKYLLCGCVIHFGEYDDGHYVSYAFRDGVWYICDDAQTVEVDTPDLRLSDTEGVVYLYELENSCVIDPILSSLIPTPPVYLTSK